MAVCLGRRLQASGFTLGYDLHAYLGNLAEATAVSGRSCPNDSTLLQNNMEVERGPL